MEAELVGPQSTFDSIFSAISDKASQLVDKARNTFSSALLPGDEDAEIYTDLNARKGHVAGEERSLFGNIYNKMSHIMPSSSRDQSKRSTTKQMSPALASQLESLWMESRSQTSGFQKPEMQQITKASVQPFKRDAQNSGYNYLPPKNPLELPSEKLQDLPRGKKSQSGALDDFNIISLIENIENPTTRRFPGRLATTGRPQKFEEIIPAVEDNYDDPAPFIVTATPRSFNVRRKGEQGRRNGGKEVLQLETLTINSTPGNFRIIQPIQIVSTVSPPRAQKKSQKLQKQIQSQRLQKSSQSLQDSSPSPNPPFQSSPVPVPHRPNSKPRPRFPKQSLTFVDNGLVAVLGRQVKGTPIEGFPNGLPDLTPLGVRITLENMIGPDGEMVMNPIPGEAGTDYPVFTEVPETGFNCGQQQYLPGIYTDTAADCQPFYMCEENGRSTAFLCPNGTIFNQQYFVCDWWYNIDCAAQPDFFSLNQFIYDGPEEGGDDYY